MENNISVHKIPEGIKEIRLDRYIQSIFDLSFSRKSARKAIKSGEIKVNGNNREPNYIISPGEIIEYFVTEPKLHRTFHLPLKILYEDSCLAAVLKPPGFPVNGNLFKTIENALPFNIKPSKEKDALRRPGPIHRIDSSTGGVLLTAKTRKAMVHLGRQFQNRSIKKKYLAIVIGRLEGSGVIKIPIDGRESETEFIAVKHVQSLRNGWLTLVELRPNTGRTHQIRRHLSISGYPIMGDKLYGEKDEILKSKGLFLWAVEISFVHPQNGNPITISADAPAKFASLLEREERRWKKYRSIE